MTLQHSVDEHLAAIDELLAPLIARLTGQTSQPSEVLSTSAPELLGRVTAQRIEAAFPLPPFDNSQMDGFAVLASDIAAASPETPVRLPIGVTTAAGDAPIHHLPGTASPVMTGAAIPHGADAVVPVEAVIPPKFPPLVRASTQHAATTQLAATTQFSKPALLGQFVRGHGEDIAAGDTLLPAATRISPAGIGALAAAGITEVAVRRRPRVLLCTTGDELSQQGGSLRPGHIYDANTPMMAAALRTAGAEVESARSSDSPEALLEVLRRRASDFDVVVTSGGISAGAFEVVREALEPLGVVFGSVAMQPGGPQGLGILSGVTEANTVPVLCFPGNPVSSMLSLELFLLPILRRISGMPPERARSWLPLAHDASSPSNKLQLRRGRIGPDGAVTLSSPGSHLLTELAAAEVIAHIPVGVENVTAGTLIETWRIND